MPSSRRVSIASDLTRLAKRREAVRGALAEQAEKIAARAQRGKAANARMLLRHEEVRAAYWAILRRYERLRAQRPAGGAADDEF